MSFSRQRASIADTMKDAQGQIEEYYGTAVDEPLILS